MARNATGRAAPGAFAADEGVAADAADFDLGEVIEGAALLASTANAVMQLALPAVGYGMLESRVEASQVMRHPFRRVRNTITYLSVALLGTDTERAYYRRQVNRAHALVRSGADSPVRYSAFDPRLQLWVAACMYRGGMDVHTRLHGPLDQATADAIYRECRRLGTTLQVPEHMWPADRAAFDRYWDSAVGDVRIDPAVRDYLHRVMMLDYLPRPFGITLGPVNRFLTTGFLPPPFREQMQLSWTEGDQRQFDILIRIVATVYRVLPAPAARFPFNASLQELRLRMMRDRLRTSSRTGSLPVTARKPGHTGLVRAGSVPAWELHGQREAGVAVLVELRVEHLVLQVDGGLRLEEHACSPGLDDLVVLSGSGRGGELQPTRALRFGGGGRDPQPRPGGDLPH
jgi:uncharacterized protein (DUF2236 family)